MAKINPQLLAAIMSKTRLSRAQVYARIKQTASTEFLPRHLAAIKVGADAGVTINKYARGDELAQLRKARQWHHHRPRRVWRRPESAAADRHRKSRNERRVLLPIRCSLFTDGTVLPRMRCLRSCARLV
jgi:hypothetical protein